ncbi:MAG: serine/threonine protein kinase, partial [Deltaproteobacteria bacterium]|nr:serine/threonine protein kinase [Deltaproteobacteria bacterium]
MTNTATERVGRYQLLEPIGVGPTGSVSRAKVFGVAGFERQFAIKRFHSELTSSAPMAQALSAAARAYGGLEHPRIARMSEFGIAQGTTFTAVEYVNGLDAMRLVAEVRLSNTMLAAGGALALVSQAARAVGYAHGRGLTHLGLSPTNVVITSEGDVKITDFGILAATIPVRAVEVPRLANRIGYLAPEQLANEATSAATDVFALGVLAYELVTGQTAFEGDSAAEIAKAVINKPPPEPSLPRPIVRVLQRCLARSPFERFPDARALADALDAALRVAPVPGTRKDIGSTVKQIIDRLADLHSGEVSGMLSFNVGMAHLGGPVAQVAALGVANRDSADVMDIATMEFVRPDTHVAGPAPLVGPASRPTRKPIEKDADAADTVNALPTMPSLSRTKSRDAVGIPAIPRLPSPPSMSKELKIPPHTVPGLAPPPIPNPPPPPSAGPTPLPSPPTTLTGAMKNIPRPLVGAVPPPKPGQGPTRATAVRVDEPAERPSESPVSPLRMMVGAPSGTAPAIPIARVIPTQINAKKQVFGALRPDTDQPGSARTDLVIETDPGELVDPELEPSLSVEMEIVDPGEEIESASGPTDRPTNEMSPILRDQLALEASRRSDEIPQWHPSSRDEVSTLNEIPEAHAELVSGGLAVEGLPVERKTLAGFQPSRSLAGQRPMSSSGQLSTSTSELSERAMATMEGRQQAPKRSKGPAIIAAVLGTMALGAGAYVVYDLTSSGESSGPVAVNDPPKDARAAATPADAAITTSTDASTAVDASAVTPADAQRAVADAAAIAPADAAVATVDAKPIEPTGGADSFSVTSTPAGARVFLDGSDSGVTPLKQPGTPDKHTIAVFSPGHELYIAQVKGQGTYAVPLKEVTPGGGPAGIKVTKCAKDRYYV